MNEEEIQRIEASDKPYHLAEICLQICSYTEIHIWYDCSFALECLKQLESGIELEDKEILRLEKTWRFLFENPFQGTANFDF